MPIYLDDIEDFDEMNETYEGYFDADPPARSTLQVGYVPKGALEIGAVAPVEYRHLGPVSFSIPAPRGV